MPKKVIGHKADMTFSYLMYEYGCTEAGRCSGFANTKGLREGSIKLPKLLKDMFVKIVTSNPSLLREIQTIGFLINGKDMLIAYCTKLIFRL